MATLAQRVTDLAAAIRNKLNLIAPKLNPAGGTVGQALTKNSATDHDYSWSTIGTLRSLTFSQPLAGFTLTNSGVAQTTTGTVTFALANDLAAVEGLTGTGFAKRTGNDTWSLIDLARGLTTFCSGKPANSEVIGGGIAPYAFNIVQASCSAKALVAATASTTFIIKKNGSQVGTIVFAASATLGTVTITVAAVALGDHLTVHAPATADATLADISIMLVG